MLKSHKNTLFIGGEIVHSMVEPISLAQIAKPNSASVQENHERAKGKDNPFCGAVLPRKRGCPHLLLPRAREEEHRACDKRQNEHDEKRIRQVFEDGVDKRERIETRFTHPRDYMVVLLTNEVNAT